MAPLGSGVELLTAYPTRIMASMRNSADISRDDGTQGAGAPAAPRPASVPTSTSISPGRRAALYGVLTAAALVCGYLELLIPLPVTVPGVKLGLGNIVILMALERLGARAGLFLMLIKVIASTLLFANLQMLVFSLAGGLLSWAVMALAVRSGAFSTVATSMLGGIAHNGGQLIAVAVLLSSRVALANMPVLAVSGVLCGAAVGVAARLVLRSLPREAFHG